MSWPSFLSPSSLYDPSAVGYDPCNLTTHRSTSASFTSPTSKVEEEAKEVFERSGLAFMGLWGFYLFP
ncbi:unnamed protein product [Boreogadus saida]